MDESVINSAVDDFNSDIAASDDGWGDDVDVSDLKDNETAPAGSGDKSKADQQSIDAATTERKPEAKTEAKSEEKTDQLFELKHFGEVKTVNKDEIVPLAQKGLDYDHVKEERDAAKAEASRLKEIESFLEETARASGMSINDLIDNTRAKLISQREGIDEAAALIKAQAMRAKPQQPDPAEKRRNEFFQFAKEHPDISADKIPAEVWAEVNAGKSLAESYTKYQQQQTYKQQSEALAAITAERDRLKAENETLKQNEKNKQRSTGTMATAGKNAAKDPIYDGWDE
jgi:cell division protein FtsB